MSIYDGNFSGATSLFDPNNFLKGAQASYAMDQLRAKNLANLQASGQATGDLAGNPVDTLNNAGLYEDANAAAAAPYAQQAAAANNQGQQLRLQGQQQALDQNAQNFQDQQEQQEAQKILQVTTYLQNIRDNQGADKVPMAFNQMMPFLQNQMGVKPEDLQAIQGQIASNPGFLDMMHNAAQAKLANTKFQAGNDGNMYAFQTDAAGNVTGKQVPVTGLNGQPINMSGAQQPQNPQSPMSYPSVPAATGLTHAAMVALAEDAQHPDAVLSVMMNRARMTGGNLDAVLQAPGQFESVMNGAANKISPAQAQALLQRPDIQQILAGNVPTQYQGLTNFYNPTLNAQLAAKDGRPAKPAWDDGTGVRIGQQLYFKNGPTGLPQPGVAGGATPAGGVTQPAGPSSGVGAPTAAVPLFGKVPKAGSQGTPTDPATLDFYAQQVNAGAPIGNFVRGRGAEGQQEIDAIVAAGRQRYGQNWNPVSAQSDLKANQGSLNQLNTKMNTLQALEGTIANNKTVAENLLAKGVGAPNLGPMTGLYSQYKMSTHDPDYTALMTAVHNVGVEYAKYQSGGTGVAPAPEGAREATETLLNPQNKTAAEIKAAFGVFDQDMAGQKAAYQQQVQALKNGIANPGVAGAAPSAPAAPAGETAAQTLARLRAKYGNR